MNILETVIVAFSMFSALPMPTLHWDGRNTRYALCAFPLIGVAIGLCSWAWNALSLALAFPSVLRGAGLCLLPVLITGGIHLDGYADTTDALSSHAGMDRRQEILKDPHLGAFAAIRLCSFFVASFALWTALPAFHPAAAIGLYGLSRCLSGIALTTFPLREGSGLARTFAENADRKTVRIILLVLSLVFSALLCLSDAWLSLPAAALVFLRYRRMCEKDFGGLSGDLAGWFVQTVELWMLTLLVLWQYLEALL